MRRPRRVWKPAAAMALVTERCGEVHPRKDAPPIFHVPARILPVLVVDFYASANQREGLPA